MGHGSLGVIPEMIGDRTISWTPFYQGRFDIWNWYPAIMGNLANQPQFFGATKRLHAQQKQADFNTWTSRYHVKIDVFKWYLIWGRNSGNTSNYNPPCVQLILSQITRDTSRVSKIGLPPPPIGCCENWWWSFEYFWQCHISTYVNSRFKKKAGWLSGGPKKWSFAAEMLSPKQTAEFVNPGLTLMFPKIMMSMIDVWWITMIIVLGHHNYIDDIIYKYRWYLT